MHKKNWLSDFFKIAAWAQKIYTYTTTTSDKIINHEMKLYKIKFAKL